MTPHPERQVAKIITQEPGENVGMEILGVAVGYDEDMRLSVICGGVEQLDDRRRQRLADELDALATAVREARAGVLH